MSKLRLHLAVKNKPDKIVRNYDDAVRVMQRATAVPKNTKVNYHDHVRSKNKNLGTFPGS
jgi:hypothetical protein